MATVYTNTAGTAEDEESTFSQGSGRIPRHLQTLLHESDLLLSSLGDGFSVSAREVRHLAARFQQGQFHLAVLGQFKRGKSSLLNALLGEPLLPMSVVPLTAIPTLLYAARTSMIRVKFADGSTRELEGGSLAERAGFLAGFVSEEGNPKNRLRVNQVEVHCPAPLLAQGVVLIDTPGIGSTLRHNTEATLNFLPQCDAALFLMSADPPITDVELEFLRQVAAKVPRLIFILNKVDYLNPSELEVVLEFLGRTLRENAGLNDAGPILPLSARQGLEARLVGDADRWERSGMLRLEQYLVHFLARNKAVALQSAISRKVGDQLDAALFQIGLATRSLQLPLADLEGRLRVFDEKLHEIERERLTARDLMIGDKKRILLRLEDQADALRKRSRQRISRALLGCSEPSTSDGPTTESIAAILEETIPVFFEHELGEFTRLFDERVSEVLRTHQRRADGLIESVRVAAAELFDISYHAPQSEAAFHLVHEPYWVTHEWESTINPVPATWLDRLFPPRARLARVMKRARQQTESLIVHNVENLRWAVLRSVDDAFARYSLEFDDRLRETVAATKGAIQAAIEKRRACRDTVIPEIEKLQNVAHQLRDLREELLSVIASGECRLSSLTTSAEQMRVAK